MADSQQRQGDDLFIVDNSDSDWKVRDYPERMERMRELADVILVDEAHHFRNPGVKGQTGKVSVTFPSAGSVALLNGSIWHHGVRSPPPSGRTHHAF